MQDSKYLQASQALKNFSAITRDHYGNYAYTTGYLESVVLELMEYVDDKHRERVVRQLEATTADFERRKVEAALKS